MVHMKCGKCAGHDAYYGVMFQNFAKQTLCMLDALTFQDSSDFGTHKPTTPFPDFFHFECHRKPNNLNIIISNQKFFGGLEDKNITESSNYLPVPELCH